MPAQADLLRPRNVVLASGAVLTAGYVASKQAEYRANQGTTSRPWLGGTNSSSNSSKLKLSDFFQPQYLRQNNDFYHDAYHDIHNDAGSNIISYGEEAARKNASIIISPNNLIRGIGKWVSHLNPINQKIDKEIELQKAIYLLLGNNLRNNGSPERIAQLHNAMIESQNRLAELMREKENPSANTSNISKPQKRIKLQRSADGSSEWVEISDGDKKENVLINPEHVPSSDTHIIANPAQTEMPAPMAINAPASEELIERQSTPITTPVNDETIDHGITTTPEYEGAMNEGVYVKEDDTPYSKPSGQPIYETDKEAKIAAEKAGYTKINERVRGHDQPIFKKGKSYISPDRTNHLGNGAWKEAKSPDAFGNKSSRKATLDINFNKIGD